ncbi:glycosyltransferase family 25 protein [Verrucomicrobium sp. BvORR034]|jgi:GR25 family glycosyltransferase involved in LPS biosynthesis|uniref:glycosyltransferase family 25 protein n=1 Tax=Verrucomicrobium sp. BvORR034 TaxID=1396418 RepID=UPI0009DE1A60|nr:glycosyltransferase family 25 protein [Verrucomicrobium sp. BvORR034]
MQGIVISLDHATERRTRFFSNARNHGWDIKQFDAVNKCNLKVISSNTSHCLVQDQSNFSASIRTTVDAIGRPTVSPGNIACALSHVLIWKRILLESLPYTFVFEDDARILKKWSEPAWPNDTDFVFIGDRVSGLLPTNIETEPQLAAYLQSHRYLPLVPGCGTEAYIVTYSGAQKALKIFEELKQPVDLQLLACAHGTRLTRHSLLKLRSPGAPECRISVTPEYYTIHDDLGHSYISDPT